MMQERLPPTLGAAIIGGLCALLWGGLIWGALLVLP
jgi:hypothetical protein